MILSVRVRVEGRVQGVGFRYFVQEKAAALGLSGWTCNRPDGTLEALAQGSRAALTQWVDALREGPPLSRVTSLTENWEPPEEILSAFVIK